MKEIGDKIGVIFIYLYEDPINPKYYWRNRGSKIQSIYDQSSEDTDSDPDDPDECMDTESTESEQEVEDTVIEKKPYIKKRKTIDFNFDDLDDDEEDHFKSNAKPSTSSRDMPKRKCSKVSKSK